MTRLYLIRHGQTDWNATGQWQGQTDIPLNQRGRAQAAALAPRLAPVALEHLYVSDLQRCVQTAALAAPNVPRSFDVRLREIDVGEVAGKTSLDFPEGHPLRRRGFSVGDPAVPFPGGESAVDLQRRAVAALHEILGRHPDGAVGIFSHGGTLKTIICHILGLTLEHRGHFRLDNCGLSMVQIEPGRQEMLCLNDTSHLAGIGALHREAL